MLNGFEDVEIEKLLDRQRQLERNVFSKPPSSWEVFHQQLGRWLELNDSIQAMKRRMDEEDEKERKS